MFAIILDEIADEARWAKTFAATQDVLAKLADEALVELQAGRASTSMDSAAFRRRNDDIGRDDAFLALLNASD